MDLPKRKMTTRNTTDNNTTWGVFRAYAVSFPLILVNTFHNFMLIYIIIHVFFLTWSNYMFPRFVYFGSGYLLRKNDCSK